MKHKLLHLQSLVSVALCVIMAIAFTSCSDDDEDELTSIIVGAWVQDGDNDIFVVNANGTGVGYEDLTDYQNNREGYKFNWSYKDGWVNITIDFYGETQIEKNESQISLTE